MTIRNKLDKTFGPAASFAGYILTFGGIFALYYSLLGLILIAIGTFLCFTTNYSVIDIENRKARNSDRLFGIFSVGEWVKIRPDMTLSIRKSGKSWKVYSMSNRSLKIDDDDYRLILMFPNNNKAVMLKKGKTAESLKADKDFLQKIFGMQEM